MEHESGLNKRESYPFNFIVEEMDALVYVTDMDSHEVLYCNKKCYNEFGNIVGGKCYKILHTDKNFPCENCSLNYQEIAIENSSYSWELTNNVNQKTYLFSDKIVKDSCNKPLKVQVGIDITMQKKLEEQIFQQQTKNLETFESLFNSTIEGLILSDINKKCIRVNNIAPNLLGYHSKEMIGKNTLDFIGEESLDFVRKVIEKDDQSPYEAYMVRKNGETFPALIRSKYISLNDEKIRVSAVIDITQIKEKEKEISRLAYYDSLTNLPNRIFLGSLARAQILNNIKDKKYGAFIFIDLDHFKTINDTKGHIVGDKILIECARRLQRITVNSEILARFGGDEFILMIDTHTKNRDDAIFRIRSIASEILKIIREPFIIDDTQYSLSASIGISLYSKEISFEELLRRADTAMHSAKEKGRDNFSFFDPLLQKALERKAVVLERLREAIELNNIDIEYQKQVGVENNIVGVEALARWNDQQLGFVSPMEFIPIAEESGLIIKFGYYLIEEVIKVLNLWKSDKQKKHWRISINVSLSQFEREDFEFFIENLISGYKIDATLLRLEITESILLKNSDRAVEKINYLKALGITISIDDFGTGYSSLAYLKKLSIDELKIDKSFIQDILTNESDEAIVTAILGIGSKFGFEVIAEGVETEEIHKKLLDLGCEYFQGYFFSKPLPKERL